MSGRTRDRTYSARVIYIAPRTVSKATIKYNKSFFLYYKDKLGKYFTSLQSLFLAENFWFVP